jgi:hypothetical protein
MLRRGALFVPGAAGAAYLLGSPRSAWSVALGAALALANLWLAGRVLGGLAENRPELLLAGAMAVFALGLAVLTGAALALGRFAQIDRSTALLALLGTHLVLVTWQAADSFLRLPNVHPRPDTEPAAGARGCPSAAATSAERS